MASETHLLALTAAGVAGLVVLVAVLRLHAFPALALVALSVGVLAGLAPLDAVRGFQEGFGSTLGTIALVIGLGTMLGRLLTDSGGAEAIARRLARLAGPERLDWALVTTAFLVAIPVFFGVGLVLLLPVLVALAAGSRLPWLRLVLPLLARLALCHSLVPPHPGPMVAVQRLGADLGLTMLWSIALGFPCALIVGPPLARVLARRVPLESGRSTVLTPPTELPARPAGFAISLVTLLLPTLLMLAAAAADALLPSGPVRETLRFVGSPLVALLVSLLVALETLGRRCGHGSRHLLKLLEESLAPVAGVLLVVGAGGGFSRVLDLAGVDDALAHWGRQLAFSPFLVGWLVCAVLRVAVGSATVAITLGAAILQPVAAAQPGTHPELLVVALASGTLMLSHVNDGGFWLVKEYFGLTVGETLRTWTVMVSLASVLLLLAILGLAPFL